MGADFIERIDVSLDLLVLLLVVVGVGFIWRIYLITGTVRDVIARLVADIESSSRRLEAARDKIDALNEELHRQAFAALEQRLKALEEICAPDRRSDRDR
jgi:hypothetical protein